jgi:hypothetical protein
MKLAVDFEKDLAELLADRVDIEAFDGDVLILSVRSFSDPAVKYQVDADFATGIARCYCPDGRIRDRWVDFTDGSGNPCKHLLLARFFIKPIYDAALKGIIQEREEE